MNRTTEFVLGLIGGIFGIISALMALFIGSAGAAFGASGASSISHLGIGALILSILGLVGGCIVKSKTKLGGIFMVVGAVGGVICVSAFYILPGILLIIGGLMALIKKNKA